MTVKDYTLYRNALDIYRQNKIEEYKKFIDNPYFSVTEKKLLNSRIKLRDKSWDEAIEILKKIPTSNSDFLLAERDALISYAYSMKGEWQQAIIFNDKAIQRYQQLHFTQQLYNSYYNQSVYYSRLGLLDLSNYNLQYSEKYAEGLVERLSINRAIASNFSKLLDYDKAIETIEKEKEELENLEMTEAVASHLLVAADIYCRAMKYEKAFTTLNRLINLKKVPFRARVLFEWAILEALVNERYTPIKWPENVKEDEHYGLKAKVIDLLLSGRHQEAKEAWIELATKEPNNYFPDFQVKYKSDQNSLYYVFIQKIRNLKKQSTSVDKVDGKLSGRVKILYELLHHNQFPISKEELIEKIWSISYDPNYDARFYKLVQRLKSTIDCEIENSHGGYLLK